jgi:hypothetical protein
MSPLDLAILVALIAWAIYRQTKVAEVSTGLGRFKMALLYAVIGLAVGGFALPGNLPGIALIVVGLLLSAVVGILRGRFTHIWVGADGRVVRRGTKLTVGLFLGLVVAKFALGTLAYFWRVDDGAGLGEVLVMIAVMIAVQAEIVYRRAAALRPTTASTPTEPSPTTQR